MNPFTALDTPVLREEEMDGAELSDARYAAIVADLARINRLTLAARPTLSFIAKVAQQQRDSLKPLRLLDVGYGQGDMLRAIARLARRNRWSILLTGVDLNPRSEAAARQATPAEDAITYRTGDYRDLGGKGWDMIVSSLVTHHMSNEERHSFLCFMETEAKAGWLVNDLHRHRVPFVGYPLLAAMARVDPVVRRDGQLSIARSFRADEWRTLLADAGITQARVRRWFPYRLCVERIR